MYIRYCFQRFLCQPEFETDSASLFSFKSIQWYNTWSCFLNETFIFVSQVNQGIVKKREQHINSAKLVVVEHLWLSNSAKKKVRLYRTIHLWCEVLFYSLLTVFELKMLSTMWYLKFNTCKVAQISYNNEQFYLL